MLGTLLHAGAAHAQDTVPTITLPQGTYTAQLNDQTGQAGTPGQGNAAHPQSGSAAPTMNDVTVHVAPYVLIQDGGSGPTLSLSQVGGVGGAGNDGQSGSTDLDITRAGTFRGGKWKNSIKQYRSSRT